MINIRYLLIIVLTLLWGSETAFAGFNTALNQPQQNVDDILVFAKKVEKELGRRGARVALVARIGIPPVDLPEGVRYTHVGLAVYSKITTDDGQESYGYAMYNLYQDDDNPAVSDLVMDYPPDFFLASYQLKTGIIIPSARLQRRLLAMISQQGVLRKFHNPHYSVISNPENPKYQNCTEYVLRLLVGAIYQTQDQRQIEANIQQYFKPKEIKVGTFRLWLGSMLTPDVFLDDHQGQPKTATFQTIAAFLKQYHLVKNELTICQHDEDC